MGAPGTLCDVQHAGVLEEGHEVLVGVEHDEVEVELLLRPTAPRRLHSEAAQQHMTGKRSCFPGGCSLE